MGIKKLALDKPIAAQNIDGSLNKVLKYRKVTRDRKSVV